VIRGLVSEGEKVRQVLRSTKFDVVGLSISPEELDAIASNPDLKVPPSSTEEEVYMRELRRFGPVEKPPPCFVEAVQLASSLDLKCHALDMGEEEFTELYCNEISGLELIRHSLRLKRLSKMTFRSKTPGDLVLEIDAFLNRYTGHRRVEEAREAYISSSIESLCSKGLDVLALVERERFNGVLSRLEESASVHRPALAWK
jgi:hypothetical protein